MNFPIHRLAACCAVALLPLLDAGPALAAANEASSDLSFEFVFSDSRSYVDMTAGSTRQAASTYSGSLDTLSGVFDELYYAEPFGAVSDSHSYTDSTLDLSTSSAFHANGGSLSAKASSNLDASSSVTSIGVSTVYQGVVLLAAGSSMNFTSTYHVSDTYTTGSPFYSFSSPSVQIIPPNFGDRFLGYKLSLAWSGGAPLFLDSGSWSTSFANTSGTDMTLQLYFNVYNIVQQGVPQPIPEPQTWAMFLGGLGLLGAWRHRRTRQERVIAASAAC